MKAASILDVFPMPSETFIVREILQLRRKAVQIVTFAAKSKSNTSQIVVDAELRQLITDGIIWPASYP